MRRLHSHLIAPATLVAALAGACGGGEDEDGTANDQQTEADRETPAPAPLAMADIRPPAFDGVDTVELIGLDYFRLRWQPATDDVSAPEQLRYEVFHVVEPYLELADDARPIYTTSAGETEAVFSNDAPPGRFYVRAVDEAGNRSTVSAGLIQRPQRPLLRAGDGTLAARVTGCVEGGAAGALCVGEEGFAARWTGDGWENLDLGLSSTLRLAKTFEGTFVYTAIGHLFRLDEAGAPHLVDLRFPHRAPELPFRQFAADNVGLRYWIDHEGRVFVGADRDFVPMTRPLALPGDECRRLRAIVFDARASFALCEEGAAFSADPTDPGARWLSLTPNAEFAITEGVEGVIAENDTEGILIDPTGLRRIGIGGWSPLLLTNWHQPGIHPMDIPEDPPPVGHVAQAFEHRGHLYAVTDIGLLDHEGAGWSTVDGTEGALAGVIGPAHGDPDSDWTYVFEDGAVGRVYRGAIRWIIPPGKSGFVEGTMTADGAAIARIGPGPDAGYYVWRERAWQPLVAAPPSNASVGDLVGTTEGGLYGFGSDEAGGGIWRVERQGWTRATWLYAPPPEPPSEAGDADAIVLDDPMAFFEPEPPPPLRSVPAGDLPAPPPAAEPIIHLDILPDGRGVAVGTHQVWWRVNGGWRLLTERPGTLSAAFVDAGETYVLIEDGTPHRCWRDDCGDLIPPAEGGPTQVLRVLPGVGGWEAFEASGAAWRFVPAPAGDVSLLIDPAVETPAGAWESTPAVGTFARTLRRRVTGPGFDALQLDDGTIHELRDGDWVLQSEDEDPLAVLAVDGGWAILTARGLFRLGEASGPLDAKRPSPDP